MQNNPFGAPQSYPQYPAPAPAPTPMPNQYPGAAPINPMGAPAPKKSKLPLIIILVSVLIVGIIAAVTIIIINSSSSSSSTSSDKDTTSKEKEKETEKPDDPVEEPTKKSTTTDKIAISFENYSLNITTNFGEDVRALSKLGDIYESVSFTENRKITDLEGFLAKTYTFDMDSDSDENRLPYVSIMEDPDDYSKGYIALSSVYLGDGKTKTKKYADLTDYAVLQCRNTEKLSVDGKQFQCGKTKGSEIMSIWKDAKKSYDNYDVQIGNFRVTFMFDGEEYGGGLDSVMIDYYEVF